MIKLDLQKYDIQTDCDITESLKILFEDIKDNEEEKILELENGFYFLSKLEFNLKQIKLNEEKTYFASVLKNIKNLTIIGKEKTIIVISDYISYLAFINCENIKLENLTFRINSPNLHKLRVKDKHNKVIDYRLSNSSEFKSMNNNVYCLGINCKEPIISNDEDRKVYRFVNYKQTTLRKENDLFVKIDKLSETKKNNLRIIYKRKLNLNVNDEIYIVDKKGINCGFYIFNSKNVEFKNITVNFSYSDLFKCIYSKNLTFKEIKTIPSKGVKISILKDAFNFNCCSGDILIEKCDLSGICEHCLHMFNPIYKAKLVDQNTIKISKDEKNIYYKSIKEGDEIVYANLKLAKIEETKKAKVSKVFDNKDSVVLELSGVEDDDLAKKIVFFNKATHPKKLTFTLNRVDKVCKTMLVPMAEEIEIKNNELIDTDKNFINIEQGLYAGKETSTAFDSNKISIISNIFAHSTKKYISIYSDTKLPKKMPCFNKVIVRRNIYHTFKRKLVSVNNVDSLVMLENVFYKQDNVKRKKKNI